MSTVSDTVSQRDSFHRSEHTNVAATQSSDTGTTSAPHYIEKSEPAPRKPELPTGLKLGLIMLALCLGVFCLALDNTIIATATPRITDDFHSLQDVGWYGSAYLLTTAGFQLFYGKLYSLFNPKLVFLSALLIFEVGSAVCGAAPTSAAFIVGRAVAGLGAAGLFSGCLIIISYITPINTRALYSGFTGMTFGIATVVGPLIGGAFTDHVTWRWSFYINLPIGAVTAVVVIFFLGSSSLGTRSRPESISSILWGLDPLGTVAFLASIVCLLLALQWGGTTYDWSDGRMKALLVLFALLLVVFVGIQYWLGEGGTVPFRVAGNRTIALCSWLGFCIGGPYFLLLYVVPIWFQAVQGNSALDSGIHTIPIVLSLVVAIFFSGGMTAKFGYYTPLIYAGAVVTPIGAGLITTWNTETTPGRWVGYQILFGFGVGLGWQLTQLAAQAVLPIEDVPIGISITFFAEIFGGAIFLSVGNNVLNTQLVRKIADLDIPSVDPLRVVALGATQLRGYVPAAFFDQTVQAYNEALIDTFRVALIVSCLACLGCVGLEWRHMKDAPSAIAAKEDVAVGEEKV